MEDATYFTHPKFEWQRRYEALRLLMVDRLPTRIVADRLGFTPGYLRLLKHRFVHGKIDFSEPVPEGGAKRRSVTAETRRKIVEYREKRLSGGEIAELLSQDGVEISVRTVERVLAEEGYSKLPRRTRVKIGLTVHGAQIPERSESVSLGDLDGRQFDCASAGVFLFAPFLAQLDMDAVIREAELPGSQAIAARSYLFSFLALKLLGTERYAHVGDHAFDPGLGLFAGLNFLPKCTALSTYSYSLDPVHLLRLQQAFVRQGQRLGLYDGRVINLDFHTAPHFGDESVLERHWAGARNKTLKAVLCLFAQDAQSKLMLYTASDIRRTEMDDQVLSFLSFWQQLHRGEPPLFAFDSRFTTYKQMSELNRQGIRFITLRRRGARQLEQVDKLTDWKRIHIPHDKRKFPHPEVHESEIQPRDYAGSLRQVIMRGNGHEKPTFLISNDKGLPVELLVGTYARRWRIENGIAEAVKFFHLNALSSPIPTKVHFDIALTMVADTLYSMLAHKLRGFEDCDASKIYRNFVQGKGVVAVRKDTVTVTFPRHAHNPILRGVPWQNLPHSLPGLDGARLVLQFQ